MRQVISNHLQAGFDSRHPLQAHEDPRSDRQHDKLEEAGSIPAVCTVCRVRPAAKTLASHARNTGPIPVHDTNGSVF